MSDIFHIREHVIPASHIREYARATANSQEDVLRLHIKQYTPKDNPNPQKGDVTVIGAHANGFPKELYEPLYEDFYHESKQKGVRIRDIWIADAAWQGQSGVLNADKLGDDPSWLDHARDIIHMINTFRMPRPLIAMAHSFGANCIVRAAITNPRLFTTVVLIDPVISKFSATPVSLSHSYAAASIYRRDVWPSKEAAAASFRKHPFYQIWDGRVLDRWLEFGLRQRQPERGEQSEVVLTTTKTQEVLTFFRPSYPAFDSSGKHLIYPEAAPDLDELFESQFPTYPFYRPEPSAALALLPNLRPSVLYIFGGKSDVAPKNLNEEKMALTGRGIGGSGGAPLGRVRQIVAEDHGHLVPMEVPHFCAKHAAEWVKGQLDAWQEAERSYEAWAEKPLAEKVIISEEFKKRMGRPERAKAPSKPKI